MTDLANISVQQPCYDIALIHDKTLQSLQPSFGELAKEYRSKLTFPDIESESLNKFRDMYDKMGSYSSKFSEQLENLSLNKSWYNDTKFDWETYKYPIAGISREFPNYENSHLFFTNSHLKKIVDATPVSQNDNRSFSFPESLPSKIVSFPSPSLPSLNPKVDYDIIFDEKKAYSVIKRAFKDAMRELSEENNIDVAKQISAKAKLDGIALQLRYFDGNLCLINHHSGKRKTIKKLSWNTHLDNAALIIFENPNEVMSLEKINCKAKTQYPNIHKIFAGFEIPKQVKEIFFRYDGNSIKYMPDCSYEKALCLNLDLPLL